MKKTQSDLTSRIAALGSGLATRPRPVEADIVVQSPAIKRPKIKNLGVRLNERDVVLLDELESWALQKKLRVGWGTLLKAGLRLMKKDQQSFEVLNEVLKSDGRRQGSTISNQY